MHWSWQELEATPMWVRYRAWEYLSFKRKAEAAAARGSSKPQAQRKLITELTSEIPAWMT